MRHEQQRVYPVWAKKGAAEEFGRIDLEIAGWVLFVCAILVTAIGPYPLRVSSPFDYAAPMVIPFIFLWQTMVAPKRACNFSRDAKRTLLPLLVIGALGAGVLTIFDVDRASSQLAWVLFWDISGAMLRAAFWASVAVLIGGPMALGIHRVLVIFGLRERKDYGKRAARDYLALLSRFDAANLQQERHDGSVDLRRFRAVDGLMLVAMVAPCAAGMVHVSGWYMLRSQDAMLAVALCLGLFFAGFVAVKTTHIFPRRWFPTEQRKWPRTSAEYQALYSLASANSRNTIERRSGLRQGPNAQVRNQ